MIKYSGDFMAECPAVHTSHISNSNANQNILLSSNYDHQNKNLLSIRISTYLYIALPNETHNNTSKWDLQGKQGCLSHAPYLALVVVSQFTKGGLWTGYFGVKKCVVHSCMPTSLIRASIFISPWEYKRTNRSIHWLRKQWAWIFYFHYLCEICKLSNSLKSGYC